MMPPPPLPPPRLVTDAPSRRKLHVANIATIAAGLVGLAHAVDRHGMDWALGAAVPAAVSLPVAAWSAFEAFKKPDEEL